MKTNFLTSLLAASLSVASLGFVNEAAAAETQYIQFNEAGSDDTIDLYRLYVNIKNVGMEKAGKTECYLASPAEKDGEQDMRFASAPERNAAWNFTLNTGGKYSLRAMTGYMLKYENRIYLNPSTDGPTQWTIEYLQDGSLTIKHDNGYLSVDASGDAPVMEFTESVTDFGKWKIERAFDKRFDLPKNSTDGTHYTYTLQLASNNYYLTGEEGSLYTRQNTADSYWYFEYLTDGTGRMNIASQQTNGYVAGNNSNGYIYYNQGTHTSWICYVYNNDAPGLTITSRNTPYDNYGTGNLGVMITEGDWVCGSQRRGSTTTWFGKVGEAGSTWIFTELENFEIFHFVELKESLKSSLESYLLISPFAHTLLNEAIDKIGKAETSQFGTLGEATTYIQNLYDTAIEALPAAIAADAVGKSVNMINVRRQGHSNSASLGWFLTGVDNEGVIKLNTSTTGRQGGIWIFEDAGDNKLYIRNRDGYYLGAVQGSTNLTTTTSLSEAGKYVVALYDGYLAFYDGSYAGLNIDTSGSDLVGYYWQDGGSTWKLQSAPIVTQYEGMPELSTDTEKKLYVITSVANPDRVMLGDDNGVSLNWGLIKEEAYWYFTADPDNDAVILHNEKYGTTVGINFGFLGNFRDVAQPFCILPFDSGDIEKGFILSTTVPASGGSVINMVDTRQACVMGNAGGFDGTAFQFVAAGAVDHEAIFAAGRDNVVALLESMLKASPWAQDILQDALAKTKDSAMTEWGTTGDAASNAIRYYFNTIVTQAEESIEIEAEDAVVWVINERRESLNKPAFLAVNESSINTSADKDSPASKWILEYAQNGRYCLRNAAGGYVSDLSTDMKSVDDKDQAGKFRFKYVNGKMAVVGHIDYDNGLNVDAGNGNLCSYGKTDAGSAWRIEADTTNGIYAVDTDSQDAAVEYYNVQGMKVAADRLVKGVYIMVKNGKAAKIAVD